MKLRVAWTFLAILLPASAQTPDLSITWIGQSAFILRTANGPTVVTDPPVASVGYALPPLTADAVTITHNHTDHNNSAAVSGTFTLVDGRPVTARQEMSAAGSTFVLIPGFHDNQNGALRGPNTMIRWTQAGLNIAHLGDLGQDSLTAAQLADLQNLDVLFIAAGGFFTVTPEQAAQYVQQLNPRIAILMHYKTALGGPAQLAGLPASAAPFSPLVYKPASVTINKATLPASTEVWVMQPLSDTVPVNAASYAAGIPVAPGSVVSAFGTYTNSQSTGASSFPLPAKLGDTEALVDGKDVPLFYVSPGQINLQVPSATQPGQSLLEIKIAGQTVSRGPLTILPSAPGLFAILNQDGQVNSAAHPAHPGEVLQIFGTGFGPVGNVPADGTAAASPVSSFTTTTPVVSLGMQWFSARLDLQFSGLAPGTAGVWQANAVLPKDLAAASGSLTITNGLTSNAITLTVAP